MLIFPNININNHSTDLLQELIYYRLHPPQEGCTGGFYNLTEGIQDDTKKICQWLFSNYFFQQDDSLNLKNIAIDGKTETTIISNIFSFVKGDDILDFLNLEEGKNLNIEKFKSILQSSDSKGFTPLISACASKNPEVVRIIFDTFKVDKEFLKESLKQKNNDGFTPLISTCAKDNHQAVEIIFDAFKNDKVFLKELLEATEDNGFTPLISACASDSPEAVRIIFDTFKDGDKEFLKELLKQKNNDGFTPLISACTRKNPEVVKIIFDAFKDKDDDKEFLKGLLKATDHQGFTPLIDACAKNNPEAVRIIFDTFKDGDKEFLKGLLKATDRQGFTPLISACAKNNPEAVDTIKNFILNLEGNNSSKIQNPENISFIKRILCSATNTGYSLLSNASQQGKTHFLTPINNILEFMQEKDGLEIAKDMIEGISSGQPNDRTKKIISTNIARFGFPRGSVLEKAFEEINTSFTRDRSPESRYRPFSRGDSRDFASRRGSRDSRYDQDRPTARGGYSDDRGTGDSRYDQDRPTVNRGGYFYDRHQEHQGYVREYEAPRPRTTVNRGGYSDNPLSNSDRLPRHDPSQKRERWR